MLSALSAPPIPAGFEATLAGPYFHDPEIYAQEQSRLFGTMWVCVGRADAIPAAGQLFTTDLGDESIIVIRGRDGEVRAFLNVCRHRGARLATTPCNEVTQTGKTIQCPYHAWSYGLDGRLLGAPNLGSNERLDKSAFGLIPVRCDVWQGLIWLNLADETTSPGGVADQLNPPLVQRFGTLDIFNRYGVGDLTVGTSITYEIEANWKLVVENFMECYHCAPVHPELTRLLPDFRNGTSYQGIPGEGTAFADDISAFTLSGDGQRPRLPGLGPEDDRTYFGFVLWPNVFVNLLPDHVILHTLRPTGPETAHVTCDWLFAPDDVARPDFDPADTVAIFDLVNRQDWDVCERTQLGMHSRAYAHGGIYVQNETHIAGFRDMVLEKLRG